MEQNTKQEQVRGHLKPDAGGTIRAGTQDGGLFLSIQRFGGGDSTVDMDLTPEEARRLGRWLLRLGKEADK